MIGKKVESREKVLDPMTSGSHERAEKSTSPKCSAINHLLSNCAKIKIYQ